MLKTKTKPPPLIYLWHHYKNKLDVQQKLMNAYSYRNDTYLIIIIRNQIQL